MLRKLACTGDRPWTASSLAHGIQSETYQSFAVLAGALPDEGDQMVFKAVQTYANGDVVRWVDPVTEGGPEADRSSSRWSR